MSVSRVVDQDRVTISFGQHFAKSEHFDAIFREGMELVETTAEYLDGAGRQQSKHLVPPLSIAYATESMRLTTRLLDMASWLLVQRALKEGEITLEEAIAKREGLSLRSFGSSIQHIKHFQSLPAGLRNLIERCHAFGERISQLDLALRATDAPAARVSSNPVNEQLRHLEAKLIKFPQRS